MKKAICILVCAVCIIAVFIGKSVLATEDVTVEIDGNVIEFDVKPAIIDGRTMVPLRKIFEEIGALVKWDEDTQTVSARKSSKTVTLAVQSSELLIDKGKTDDEGNPIVETVMLDVSAQIIQDRTLVPLRAVAESFGLGVEWDEDNQKVTITSDDGEDESWKENVGSINLTERTFEGEGIAINENQIIITSGGDFTLTGTLTDGNIVISAQEKVKLRLSGVTVTSCENPCIFAESAEKVYITLTDKTQNTLIAEK